MDTLERNQIRLVIQHLSSQSLHKTNEAQKAMHADHSAKSMLRSGNTIRSAVSIIEDEASLFVERSVDQVAAIAQDLDAFNVIYAGLTTVFRGYEKHLDEAIKLSTSGEVQRFKKIESAGKKLFFECRGRTFKQLEIHRYSFIKPSRGDLAAQRERIFGEAEGSRLPSQSPKSGGKPLAKHWDAMWAEMATQLWAGDLKPESQADIKKAMFDWLNGQGVDAGDTAVTERARALWQRMQAET